MDRKAKMSTPAPDCFITVKKFTHMKKIYYLLALLALAFTACQKQPVVEPTSPLTKTADLTFTLAAADYQLLPKSAYPYTSLTFNTATDANNYIPVILAAKWPLVNNKSTATVTYTLAPPPASIQAAAIQIPDTLYSDVTYTVTSADYFAVTGNHYGDFAASDVLKFLAYKYPSAVANQLAVITYVLYTGTDNTVTNSFLFLNGAWIKIYQVTPAQYTLAGEGKYDQFTGSDASKLVGYFNFFLKNDFTIAVAVKAGDVEYVSYSYYGGKAYQRVMGLTYDGANYVTLPPATQATQPFLKTNGTWAAVLPVPTFTHPLTSADITLIVNSTAGTAAERTNLGKYGDFSSWLPSELDAAFIVVLTADYPTPVTGDNYNIVYLNYTGGADVPTTITFVWNGTAWAAK
jgi:hypothetical protein